MFEPVKARSALQDEERARHLEWIEWLRAKTGRSLSEIAEGAGLSSNTLTRLKARDGALLDTLSIRLLSEFTGLPGPQLYKLGANSGFTEEGTPYDRSAPEADPSTAKIIETLLKSRPNAAPWQSQDASAGRSGLHGRRRDHQ